MTAQGAPQEVVEFWRSAGPKKWFAPDAAFDAEIRKRFLAAHEQAAAGKLPEWERSAQGALALLLLLDQFPRNMFRKTPRAFATDAQALEVARRAIKAGFDLELTRAVADAVSIPVIASGGVGTLDHLVDGITKGHASAVLAASIFHFGTYTIGEAKRHMAEAGIAMRPAR